MNILLQQGSPNYSPGAGYGPPSHFAWSPKQYQRCNMICFFFQSSHMVETCTCIERNILFHPSAVCALSETRNNGEKIIGKRKIDSECRVFNLQFTNDYFLFNAKERLLVSSVKRQWLYSKTTIYANIMYPVTRTSMIACKAECEQTNFQS